MPPYMAPRPSAGPSTPGGRLLQRFNDYNQHQSELDNALAESGRDPFAERLQSQIPLNRAATVSQQDPSVMGRLFALSQLIPGLQMRGGLDNPLEALLPKLKGIARGMNAKQADDLTQAGAETIARRMQTQSIGGPEAVRMARTGMRNELAKGGTGVRSEVSRAIDDAVNNVGNVGEYRLWSEVRKKFPGMSLEDFRNARANIRPPMASLDAEAGGEGRTLADFLRSSDNPEQAAALKEKLAGLTDSQQANLAKHIGGEPVNRAIIDRILKKLEIRQGPGGYKPISGGSGQGSGFESLEGFRPSTVMNEPIHEEQLPLSISDFWKDVGPAGNGHTQIGELGQGRLAGTTSFLDQGGQLPNWLDEHPLTGAHPSMRSMDRFVPGGAANIHGTQDELDQLRGWLMDAATSASRN